MRPVVLDASIALAHVLTDEHSEAIAELLRECGDGRIELFTAAHWMLELANAILVAGRRGRIPLADRLGALETLARFPVTIVPESPTASALLSLADSDDLTVYDAAYLSLSIERRAELATADTALAEAARRRQLLWVRGTPTGQQAGS